MSNKKLNINVTIEPKNWVLILQQERDGVIKKNQWMIIGILVYIIPLFLFVIYYFLEQKNPIIPRIFGGIILNFVLIGILIIGLISPAILFIFALDKVNQLNELMDKILIEKIRDENKIIEIYKNIVRNNNLKESEKSGIQLNTQSSSEIKKNNESFDQSTNKS